MTAGEPRTALSAIPPAEAPLSRRSEPEHLPRVPARSFPLATLVVVPVHEGRPAVFRVVHLHQRRDVLPCAGDVADAVDYGAEPLQPPGGDIVAAIPRPCPGRTQQRSQVAPQFP